MVKKIKYKSEQSNLFSVRNSSAAIKINVNIYFCYMWEHVKRSPNNKDFFFIENLQSLPLLAISSFTKVLEINVSSDPFSYLLFYLKKKYKSGFLEKLLIKKQMLAYA